VEDTVTTSVPSDQLDQHPRSMEDWIILQSGPVLGLGNHIFANLSSHLSALLLLDVDLMSLIEVFNSLHGEVGLHLICSSVYLRIKYLFFEKSCGPS